jgi:hypothetical protein
MPAEDELAPLKRYFARMTEDPLRLYILAAHALIEETIENAVAEAVPNSECFNVPRMPFWEKLKIIRTLAGSDERSKAIWTAIEKLNKLRNAAAHKDYDKLRDERFADLANFFYPDPTIRAARSREILLHELVTFCGGFLAAIQYKFRNLRKAP